MILSFKPQFVEPILDFSKIHTIRLDPHNRWKAGTKIHFATGIRTKSYRQFMEGECKGVQKIEIILAKQTYSEISHTDNLDVFINGSYRSETRRLMQNFFENDGFENQDEFIRFFFGNKPTGKFKGKIIHWTDFKY